MRTIAFRPFGVPARALRGGVRRHLLIGLTVLLIASPAAAITITDLQIQVVPFGTPSIDSPDDIVIQTTVVDGHPAVQIANVIGAGGRNGVDVHISFGLLADDPNERFTGLTYTGRFCGFFLYDASFGFSPGGTAFSISGGPFPDLSPGGICDHLLPHTVAFPGPVKSVFQDWTFSASGGTGPFSAGQGSGFGLVLATVRVPEPPIGAFLGVAAVAGMLLISRRRRASSS